MQVPHRFSLEKKEWATQAQEIGANPGGPQKELRFRRPKGVIPEGASPERRYTN